MVPSSEELGETYSLQEDKKSPAEVGLEADLEDKMAPLEPRLVKAMCWWMMLLLWMPQVPHQLGVVSRRLTTRRHV